MNSGSGFLDDYPSARYVVAAACGAIIGVIVSFTVNCTLVEISIQSYFAVYFGLLFMFIAGIIVWRVKNGGHPKPFVLMSFASLVFISGLLCFVLQREWFVRMNWLSKVPVYALLGMSVTFAIVLAIVDAINWISGRVCQDADSKPLVETEMQVYLLATTAIVMGLLFGMIFGLLDIEDEQVSHIKVALLRENKICNPIGAALGACAAGLNEYLRQNSSDHRFDPLKDDNPEDDNF